MDLFISAHKNYNYENLYIEIEYLQKQEEESLTNFNFKIIQNYYRFHDDDWPLEKYFLQLRLSLIHK